MAAAAGKQLPALSSLWSMRPRSTASAHPPSDDGARQGPNAPRAATDLPAGHRLFLTANETAGLLRTSTKAVYALIERRQIPGVVRLGRRVLVRSDVLLDWLQRQESKGHR